MSTKRDETLEEIWAIRRQTAKRFGGDPRKRVAYYQRRQKESGAKIYRPEIPTGADLQAFDALHDRAHAEVAAGQYSTLTTYRAARKRKAKGAK
ncbi:MAG: hypothetical protein HY301_11480 [Verrucomicrobia bacterium]|nr:hypothetical protein [Verrucomicrobiota bacterium]